MSDEPTRISLSDVSLLWHSDFYDYPRAGALRWNGERFWFQEAGHEGLIRLYALTEDEWAHEDTKHAAFRELVGEHCDYDSGQCRLGAVRPGGLEAWQAFYDDPRWKQKSDYTGRSPVAEFDILAASVGSSGDTEREAK